ncbi:MAG: TRAP transporter permease [Desulfobacteraceae bacterium]|nr:TRAP transporter permease [Desulfobacteraceae bacterium]MBU4054016.1 TRAP transporter permease [Pseudomonadota bacterium]
MNKKRQRSVEEIYKAESGNVRSFNRIENFLVSLVAVSWALYQLALPSFQIVDSTTRRSIHLAFAMTLVFLLLPCVKRPLKQLRFLSTTTHVPLMDYFLSGIGTFSALYLAINYEALSMRAGVPVFSDLFFGVLLVVLLLEATRRMVGPALSFIAILFSAYAFLGPHMPSLLAFKGVSLSKYLSNITLSTEGIYGIPLGVSSSIVYLFVLLGAIMDRAGAGLFFTNIAISLLGRYKGGVAKAAIVASGATGIVSGSSIANIVTTGPFTIPLMKKVGYPAEKAAAIEVAASTDGQLMPPIMGAAAFIIAEYVNVPYIEVVKAAIIPALVSYFGLLCISHLEASKLGIKGLPPEDLPDFFQTFKKGIHYILPLGVLLWELMVFRHSPELAAFRAIMVLFGVIFYQEIRLAFLEKRSWGSGVKKSIGIVVAGLIQGSKNMVAVALACAAAGIIVGVVNMGIGGMISGVVESLAGGNIFLLLFITAVACLIIGMGLPTTATYIVMATLTAPIIVKVGGSYGFVVPIMAAHLFCFYFGILADDTPPVGLAAYTAAAIAESDPIATGIQGFLYDIRTSCIAFMFIFNPDLILFNITSWSQGLLIFVMALAGMAAFSNFAQGWCLTKNKWYELPLFLGAWFVLFNPGATASFFHVEEPYKYYFYLLGLTLYGGVTWIQRFRLSSEFSFIDNSEQIE